ncbi:MAG: hypothetical protein VYB44_07195 [Bacteroidota bacterium]|nr:hypothetical protein [Bacteroidota bacterium]
MSIIPIILGAIFGWFLYDWMHEMKITIHYQVDDHGVSENSNKTVNFFELMHLLISRKTTISRKLKVTFKRF